MTFGEKLKHYRNLKHMTQSQLAHAARLGTNTIINYENGNTYPRSQGVYLRLAEVLGIPEGALKDDSINVDTLRLSTGAKAGEASAAVRQAVRSSVMSDDELHKFSVSDTVTVKHTSEPRELASRLSALFAGGKIPEEDREEIINILNEAYWKSKIG